jgi:hypothetical protein
MIGEEISEPSASRYSLFTIVIADVDEASMTHHCRRVSLPLFCYSAAIALKLIQGKPLCNSPTLSF